LIVFIDLVGFGIVLPLLPLYGHRYGAGPLVLGVLLAAYSTMQFVFAPIWGRLSDRHGRRPILLVSLAGQAFGYLLFGLATGLPLLFASRLLAGVCAANIGTAQAVVADLTPPDRRARGMGLIGAAFGLGFIMGPAAGGMLAAVDPRWPGLGAAGLSSIAFLLTWLRLPETRVAGGPLQARRPWNALNRTLSLPGLGLLIACGFLVTFAFSGLESTFSLLVDQKHGLSQREIGFTFAYLGVLSAVVQGGLVGRLAGRIGERRLMHWGMGLTCLGMAVVPAAPNRTLLIGLLPLLAVGLGLTNPSLSALVSRTAPGDRQGSVLGAFQSAASLARILGPIWASFGYGTVSPWWPYLTGASWVGVALALSLTQGARNQRAG
jgi:multidrug resistance protein